MSGAFERGNAGAGGARPLRSFPNGPLLGSIRPIGDKSLSHRALILAALAAGPSTIVRPNPGEDVEATAEALARLGASLERTRQGWSAGGTAGRLRDPDSLLDLRNSGTGIRLLAGVVAGTGRYAVLSGDASLRRRPMRRVAEPLRALGACVHLRDGELPPVAVQGGEVRPATIRLPVASAQVKSAILLAGLGLSRRATKGKAAATVGKGPAGAIIVEEPGPSRDHTERLLQWLGYPIEIERGRIVLGAREEPHAGFRWEIPSDPSAAAFFAVAAALVEGSDLTCERVAINPTRTGAFEVLRAMGADLEIVGEPGDGPEPAGAIRARGSRLHGTVVAGDRLVRCLDEVPILAVAAAAAEGETRFLDAAELRVKESDRIEATAALVRALGAEAETGPDWLIVRGTGGRLRGARVETRGDHRIAMSALVAGCAADAPVEIDDGRSIDTSDPSFLDSMRSAGAGIEGAGIGGEGIGGAGIAG
ncbi:MAG: 3-phosphoshikimate 1-carboxyvinyltransferase [Candidatus Eisenbacteria bacterium]